MDHSYVLRHLCPASFDLMFTLLINLLFVFVLLLNHSDEVFVFFEIIIFKFLKILQITSFFLEYLIYLHPRN